MGLLNSTVLSRPPPLSGWSDTFSVSSRIWNGRKIGKYLGNKQQNSGTKKGKTFQKDCCVLNSMCFNCRHCWYIDACVLLEKYSKIRCKVTFPAVISPHKDWALAQWSTILWHSPCEYMPLYTDSETWHTQNMERQKLIDSISVSWPDEDVSRDVGGGHDCLPWLGRGAAGDAAIAVGELHLCSFPSP